MDEAVPLPPGARRPNLPSQPSPRPYAPYLSIGLCTGLWRRWFLPAALLAAVAATAGAIQHAGRRSIPRARAASRLPVPNAFDTYLAAVSAEVNPILVEVAIGGTVGSPPPTLSQQRALLAQNSRPLALVYKGLHEVYWLPTAHTSEQAARQSLQYSRFRYLEHLLQLKQYLQEIAGDWSGAVQTGIDGLRMGIQAPRGGGLMAVSVANAIQAIARQRMWAEVSHLSASQAAAAARRMQSVASARYQFSDVLRTEARQFNAGLLATGRTAAGKQQIVWLQAGYMDHSVSTAAVVAAGRRLEAGGGVPGLVARSSVLMSGLIGEASRRYGLRPSRQLASSDQLLQDSQSVAMTAWFQYALQQTEDDLLRVDIALRAYCLEHSEYPKSLRALVPRCLKSVPQDPFARSGALRYKRRGSSFVLYSVGPDRIDDGGRPVAEWVAPGPWSSAPKQSRVRSHLVREESRGDIVAGMNVN